MNRIQDTLAAALQVAGVEIAIDRAGLYWLGLGVGLHIYVEPRAAHEPMAHWNAGCFRVGPFMGALDIGARRRRAFA